MAARNIRASLSRTGVALAALTIALSMSIGMATMVSSFRLELQDWIENVIRADIYLTPATTMIDRTHARFDNELVALLSSRPGVRAVDSIRRLPARVGDFETFAAGVDVAVYRSAALPRIIEGPDPETFFDLLEAGQAGVSESLMRKTGLESGDRFVLEAKGRSLELEVAGIYRDYSSDRGVVLLDRGRFEESFGEQAPNGMALYLEPGRDVDREVDSLKRELASDYALLIQSNRGLREQANIIFERTFSVARALEMIGITVAAMGILAALLAMLLERQREIATLRALGLTLPQLRRLLLGESLLLAGLAWTFALAGGSGLAWILLRVINLRSFGWMLPFHVPYWDWALNLFWSLLAAGLATWLPIVRSRRLPVATALREE
jgi:putative ABC transport system permease protein